MTRGPEIFFEMGNLWLFHAGMWHRPRSGVSVEGDSWDPLGMVSRSSCVEGRAMLRVW
jgi:hypothetical protein